MEHRRYIYGCKYRRRNAIHNDNLHRNRHHIRLYRHSGINRYRKPYPCNHGGFTEHLPGRNGYDDGCRRYFLHMERRSNSYRNEHGRCIAINHNNVYRYR